MRVLCDTNILARAATRPGGPAHELVRRLVESADHWLIVTPFVLEELIRVLGYARMRLRSQATDEELATFVDSLERCGELVVPLPKADADVLADPNDDPILSGAIQGGAQALCTRDRHFYRSEVLSFCQLHNLRVLDELQLLDELRQANP